MQSSRSKIAEVARLHGWAGEGNRAPHCNDFFTRGSVTIEILYYQPQDSVRCAEARGVPETDGVFMAGRGHVIEVRQRDKDKAQTIIGWLTKYGE